MTLTLTANIDAADRYLTVTGTVPDDIAPTYRFRLGDELLELQAFVVKTRETGRAGTFTDRNEWYILRGLDTSDAASHTAGTEIKGATDAYVAATSGPTPPSPWSSGGGSSGPVAFTERVLSADVVIPENTGAVFVGPLDLNGHTIDASASGSGYAVIPAQGSLTMALAILDFQETAGAGTYTASIPLPAHAVVWECYTVGRGAGVWDADSALLDAWDSVFGSGDPAYVSGLNLSTEPTVPYDNESPAIPTQYENIDGLGGKYSDNGLLRRTLEDPVQYETQPGVIYDAPDTITARIVTTGAGGTTGHLQVFIVGFGVPGGFYEAVKS